jgi:hypothetical protein
VRARVSLSALRRRRVHAVEAAHAISEGEGLVGGGPGERRAKGVGSTLGVSWCGQAGGPREDGGDRR